MNEKEYGFVTVSRKQFNGDDPLWDDGTVFDSRSAWIWLIQSAAWKDSPYHTRFRLDELKRGEFVVSLRFLATRFKWSHTRVQRYLRMLEKTLRITLQRMGQHGTVYLINNYDTYQLGGSKRVTPSVPADDTLTIHPRYKVEESKEVKKRTNTVEYSPEFEEFWRGYPKRSGSNPKHRAASAYRARRSEGHTPAVILAGRDRYTAYLRAQGSVGTPYVQQAATFLSADLPFLEDWTVGIAAMNGDRLVGVGTGIPTDEELRLAGIFLK